MLELFADPIRIFNFEQQTGIKAPKVRRPPHRPGYRSWLIRQDWYQPSDADLVAIAKAEERRARRQAKRVNIQHMQMIPYLVTLYGTFTRNVVRVVVLAPTAESAAVLASHDRVGYRVEDIQAAQPGCSVCKGTGVEEETFCSKCFK